MIRKFYDLDTDYNPGIAPSTSSARTYVMTTIESGARIEATIVPSGDHFMTMETVVTNHQNLLDAMKSQAAKNLEVVNDIFAKAAAFEAEYKPKAKKKK